MMICCRELIPDEIARHGFIGMGRAGLCWEWEDGDWEK